jgi:hypothetical protein
VVRTSLGVLLDLGLDKAQRKEQYDHILIAREKYLAETVDNINQISSVTTDNKFGYQRHCHDS